MNNLNTLILEGIELKNGKVTYNDCEIDPDLPFAQQELSFKHDLLQIKFDSAEIPYTVDVGWLPEFDENGKFIIQVIKNYDWHKPVSRKKVKTFTELKQCLQEAIDIVDCLIHGTIC